MDAIGFVRRIVNKLDTWSTCQNLTESSLIVINLLLVVSRPGRETQKVHS